MSDSSNAIDTSEKTIADEADKMPCNSQINSTKSSRVSTSLNKKQQKASEKAEMLKIKEEKDKQKMEEKLKKEKEKEDMKLKKETKEREKDLKRKQREEDRRIKSEQIEDKKKKDEAKQEEKKRIEDEKRKEDERKVNKSQKEKELMRNFFIKETPVKLNSQNSEMSNEVGAFMAFEVKKGMVLAPLTRFVRNNLEKRLAKLDTFISEQVSSSNYLLDLKNSLYKPGRSFKNNPNRDEDVIVVTVEAELSNGYAPSIKRKMKLLQFHDNYRPAYYGTNSKVTKVVNPRQPFLKDLEVFDYEVDSDEEWEEDEPGESISHSEGEDEGEEDGGNEDNEDKFFVPHGYLSEGEGCDDEDLSPETLKQKQLIRARNWEEEMKENVKRLQPISIGVLSWHARPQLDRNQSEFLKKFMAQPIEHTLPIKGEILGRSDEEQTEMKAVDKRHRVQGVPEEAMTDVIKLVHGCGFGINKMVKEFIHFWSRRHSDNKPSEDEDKSKISKRQLEAKIRKIACYKKNPERHSYRLWYVDEVVLEKYNLKCAPVPSEWNWSNIPTAKKLPKINQPMCETPKQEKVQREMLTPKTTPKTTTSPHNSLTKKNNTVTSGSIKQFMTPMGDAVSSEISAKRRVCTTVLLSEISSTPGVNANFSSSCVAKETKKHRKRLSSVDIQSENKRVKTGCNRIEEDKSNDCMIVEDSNIVRDAKFGSCFVQLFKLNAKIDDLADSDNRK